MSNNLLKCGFVRVEAEGREIDTNLLVAKRIEELAVRVRREEDADPEGFVSGLEAEDVSGLFSEGGDSHAIRKRTEEEAKRSLEQAAAEAEELVNQAKAEAEQILMEARERAENEKKAILDKAKEQGYNDGQKQAMQEAEKLRKELALEKKKLEKEFEKQMDSYEPRFIDTITGIYEHIFHVDMASQREVLVHLISNAMRKVEISREFVIRVSKEDYPYVSMQKKQLAACAAGGNGSVVVTEDGTLEKNQCLIETDGGIFDCGVDTQMEELEKKLKLLSYEKR